MVRTYLTPLPHTLSFLQLEKAEVEMKLKGIWDQLPEELKERWDTAGKSWTSITIVKAELDMIPDGPWVLLAPELGITWAEIPDGIEIHKG